VGLKLNLNFIVTLFNVNFLSLKEFQISGRLKNIAVINMAFTFLAVTVLAVMLTGFIQTSTLKFPFVKTMSTTTRFSMLVLTDFAFLAPANFIQSFFAMTATTTTANSVRSAKIILLKLGRLLIVMASVSTSATTA